MCDAILIFRKCLNICVASSFLFLSFLADFYFSGLLILYLICFKVKTRYVYLEYILINFAPLHSRISTVKVAGSTIIPYCWRQVWRGCIILYLNVTGESIASWKMSLRLCLLKSWYYQKSNIKFSFFKDFLNVKAKREDIKFKWRSPKVSVVCSVG